MADMVADMVADMEVDMVADMETDIVADMEVDHTFRCISTWHVPNIYSIM